MRRTGRVLVLTQMEAGSLPHSVRIPNEIWARDAALNLTDTLVSHPKVEIIIALTQQ